jgi:hypothetical protein
MNRDDFQALPVADQARLLAMWAHRITTMTRETYENTDDESSATNVLRLMNRAQHRVLKELISRIKTRTGHVEQDDDMFLIAPEPAFPDLSTKLQSALRSAWENYFERSGKPAPLRGPAGGRLRAA